MLPSHRAKRCCIQRHSVAGQRNRLVDDALVEAGIELRCRAANDQHVIIRLAVAIFPSPVQQAAAAVRRRYENQHAAGDTR